MRSACCAAILRAAILLFAVALLLPETLVLARHVAHHRPHSDANISPMHAAYETRQKMAGGAEMDELAPKKRWRHGKPHTLQVAGSKLPDCTHACGSCSPCRLVMVSFVCAAIQEAETCPMAYKCMCNSKAYPVP